MPHDFEHDVRVAIYARTLPLGCEMCEHLRNVRHVEVSAQTQVLGLPVVTAQEGVYVLQSATSCGGISQVSHIKLSDEGWAFAGNIVRSGDFCRPVCRVACYLLIDIGKNLCDGILSLCLFAIHVFMSGFPVESHASHSSTFLSAVVLFFHHEIELAEAIFVRAVLFGIEAQRFQQSHHGDATFMFKGFHRGVVCMS